MVCTASEMFCTKNNRASNLMSARKQKVTRLWPKASISQPTGVSQMKLQSGIRSLCIVPGTKVCQKLQTSSAHIYKSIIRANTEALIMAAQEQALNTRAVAHTIYRTVQDPRCRLCKQHAETVTHITSGCSKLAGIEYTERLHCGPNSIQDNMC